MFSFIHGSQGKTKQNNETIKVMKVNGELLGMLKEKGKGGGRKERVIEGVNIITVQYVHV
jgi:hypothetical protein